MSAPVSIGGEAQVETAAEHAGIATAKGANLATVGASQVAFLLRDRSMRVFEAALALGALATALLLGIGR